MRSPKEVHAIPTVQYFLYLENSCVTNKTVCIGNCLHLFWSCYLRGLLFHIFARWTNTYCVYTYRNTAFETVVPSHGIFIKSEQALWISPARARVCRPAKLILVQSHPFELFMRIAMWLHLALYDHGNSHTQTAPQHWTRLYTPPRCY
jgi:hypothetical protein